MESGKETIKRWMEHLEYCRKMRALGLPLTKDEEEYEDFIDQKLDDYRSDWYGMENY